MKNIFKLRKKIKKNKLIYNHIVKQLILKLYFLYKRKIT